MKKIFILSLIFLFPCVHAAKRYYSEAQYKKLWCEARKGRVEVALNDKTRVDCLTSTLAVEFDFAPKWAECIGQALYYGQKTNRTPACVLIMEHGEKDLKHLKRLRYTVYNKKKIPEFKTFTMTPEHVCNSSVRTDCPHMQTK